MLDSALKEQVRELFSNLLAHYTLRLSAPSGSGDTLDSAKELLGSLAECSENVSLEIVNGSTLCIELLKDGKQTGVSFRAVPGGHEFTSLLLAILNADGKGKNLPDQFTASRIARLKGKIKLTTYMSLTCTNCPDVVQALNVVALIADNVEHEAVDGALFESEVNSLNVQSVPTVYADGKMLHVGRATLGELLDKIEAQYGTDEAAVGFDGEAKNYDVIVAGGGPAGVTAAIYSARKGLSVALVAGAVGGQVKETVAIENFIATPQTTGAELAQNLRAHLGDYQIDVLENRQIESVTIDGSEKVVMARGGEEFRSKYLIVATGASWRKLGVAGEDDYMGRGVAYCPHCDGPFYKDKEVAVVGGGNSGVEAAIDLAGICSKVTVLEFLDELKADSVLQEKLRSLSNVEIRTGVQTTEIVGNGDKVTGVAIKDRSTERVDEISLSGVFVQIGLVPNSAAVRELVEVNRGGEIVVDRNGRSSELGIYGAGDVTDVSYKQIIVAMGEGAKAALAAFDDRVRGVL